MLLVVTVALVAAVAIGRWEDGRRAEWESRAQAAEQLAQQQVARADSAESRAAMFEARAEDLARTAVEQGRRARERAEVVRVVEAPDTCAPFLAARDSVIDEALTAVETWEAAHAFQVAVNAELHVSIDALRVAVDSLNAVVASRPKPRSKLLPRVGPFVGVCQNGAICAGVGLQWSF